MFVNYEKINNFYSNTDITWWFYITTDNRD